MLSICFLPSYSGFFPPPGWDQIGLLPHFRLEVTCYPTKPMAKWVLNFWSTHVCFKSAPKGHGSPSKLWVMGTLQVFLFTFSTRYVLWITPLIDLVNLSLPRACQIYLSSVYFQLPEFLSRSVCCWALNQFSWALLCSLKILVSIFKPLSTFLSSSTFYAL